MQIYTRRLIMINIDYKSLKSLHCVYISGIILPFLEMEKKKLTASSSGKRSMISHSEVTHLLGGGAGGRGVLRQLFGLLHGTRALPRRRGVRNIQSKPQDGSFLTILRMFSLCGVYPLRKEKEFMAWGRKMLKHF